MARQVVTLDLAVLQRLEACSVVGDRPEDEFFQLGLVAPVVVVPDHHEPVTARPRFELERAGAGRVLGSAVPVSLNPVSSSTEPSSAPNSCSAFGLANVKFVSASAPRNEDDGFVS